MTSTSRLSAADDLLAHQLPRPVSVVDDGAPSWFDRLYFCLHPPGVGPIVVVGAGVYPNADVIDGYACLQRDSEQRNLLFSDRLDDRLRMQVGPLRWEVLEPLNKWRLVIDENPESFSLDAVYTARNEPWLVEPIAVTHAQGPQTEFAHFFQCGRWDGVLTVDGKETSIEGWPGVRDRSWGVRRTRERLGMHLWVVAQFDDVAVSIHYNEFRDGRPQHCDGAVFRDGHSPVAVAALEHDIEVDDGLELVRARFGVPIGGRVVTLECEGLHRGLYMAGAGYGGWHGRDHGVEHLEAEHWTYDGTFTARTLSLGLVDKICRFEMDKAEGVGIVELALSRSATYRYQPRRLESPQ
jgi:hypothetical protein